MSSLTDKLIAVGVTETIYPASLGREAQVTLWMPKHAWNGVDTKDTFFLRYGHYNEAIHGDETPVHPERYSAGAYVGEGLLSGEIAAWDPAVVKVLRDFTGDPSWQPDAQDKMDLKLVKDPDGMSTYFSVRSTYFSAHLAPQIRATMAAASTATTATPTKPSTADTTTGSEVAAHVTTAPDQAPKILSALADLRTLKTHVQGHGGKPMRDIEHQLEKIIWGLST